MQGVGEHGGIMSFLSYPLMYFSMVDCKAFPLWNSQLSYWRIVSIFPSLLKCPSLFCSLSSAPALQVKLVQSAEHGSNKFDIVAIDIIDGKRVWKVDGRYSRTYKLEPDQPKYKGGSSDPLHFSLTQTQ